MKMGSKLIFRPLVFIFIVLNCLLQQTESGNTISSPSPYATKKPHLEEDNIFTDINYSYRKGFLAAGDDLFVGSFNYTGALDYCSTHILCMGITFDDTSSGPTPSISVNVFFKTSQHFVEATGWASYLKVAPPAYPDVNFTFGGVRYGKKKKLFNVFVESLLQLLGLRPNSHSIMIASIQDDPMPPFNFSWVPPLQAYKRPSRNLPGCHQLGDITVRVQPLNFTNASSYALFSSSWAGFSSIAPPLPKPWPTGVVQADDITSLLLSTPSVSRVETHALSLTAQRFYQKFVDPVSGVEGMLMTFKITAAADGVRLGGIIFIHIVYTYSYENVTLAYANPLFH